MRATANRHRLAAAHTAVQKSASAPSSGSHATRARTAAETRPAARSSIHALKVSAADWPQQIPLIDALQLVVEVAHEGPGSWWSRTAQPRWRRRENDLHAVSDRFRARRRVFTSQSAPLCVPIELDDEIGRC